MTLGTSIRVEDLDVYTPVDEKDGARIKHSKSYKRGGSVAHHNKKSRTYKLYLANDAILSQLEEMTRNPYFASVPIYDMPKRINTGFIERYSRKGQYGASDIGLTMAHGYGKFLYIWDEIERPLHDRWRILISEDFSTDLGAYPQPWQANAAVFGANTSADSLGDADQIQDIPWEEVSGAWETDTDLGDHLSGTQCVLYISNTTVGNLVAGWDWWENYIVESWIRIDDNTGDNVGISFRYVDVNNHYLFYTDDATEIILAKRVGGALTRIIGNTTFNITTTTWYHYKVEVQGHRIKCYVNGNLMIDIIDTEFTSGLAGMYAYNDNTYFDNFKVTLLPTVNFNLPASIDWHNQYSHADIETAYGTQKKLIAPDNNVQFKQSKAGTDCILYLPMNEGTGTPRDHSKNNFAVELHGATWVDDKEKGWCLDFDGFDDYLYLMMNNNRPSTYTIDLEFKNTSGGNQGILHMDYRPLIYLDTSNQLRLYYLTGAYIHDVMSDDTWYRVTVIVEKDHGGTTTDFAHLFIDGKYIGHLVQTTMDSLDDNKVYIGQYGANTFFDGKMKDIRVFDTARWDVAFGFDSTPATVFIWDDNRYNADYDYPDDSDCVLLLHMDEGFGTDGDTTYDASGHGNDATLTDITGWGSTSFRGEAGTCLDFESANTDYLTIGDDSDFSFNGDVPFSIEAWVNPESLANFMGIISKFVTAGNLREWIVLTEASGSVSLILYHNDNSAWIWRESTTVMSINTWYHLVITYDGSETISGITIYINGIAESSYNDSTSGVYTGMTNTTSDVQIGRYDTGQYFDGLIDEVRVHRRELSANEVAARYRSEPYLHDWYQCTRAYDISHDFKGLPIISNGLIMLSFPDYDVYEYRQNNILFPTLYGWYENAWHELCSIGFMQKLDNDEQYLMNAAQGSEWELIELTDQYCKIRIRYYLITHSDETPEGTECDLILTIRNGYPCVFIEIDDRDFFRNEEQGWILLYARYHGRGTNFRGCYSPSDQLLWSPIDIQTFRDTSEVDDNWHILFHSPDDSNAPSKNFILGTFGDCMNDDIGTDDLFQMRENNNIWYQTEVQVSKTGGIFFVPYDVDDLFAIADTTETGVTGTGTDDQNVIAGGSQSDGEYLLGGAALEYIQWQIDAATNLPKGTYMAVARVASTDATGAMRELHFNVDNDADQDGDLATITVTIAAANTWENVFLLFYTDGTNDVYLSVENESQDPAGDIIYVDYFLCIPLANAIDYPSDLAHYAFNEQNLIRGLKK